MERIFEALASAPRRQILSYLAEAELTAGQIAARFAMSKPALSKHLRLLENAGLVESDRRGQFVVYRLVRSNLINTLHGFAATLCPVSRPLQLESLALKQHPPQLHDDDPTESTPAADPGPAPTARPGGKNPP